MARQRIASAIDTSGPFFTYDPAKTFRKNARAMLAELAEQGEQDVQVQLRQGQGARARLRYVDPDRVSGHVVGRVRSLKGKPWALTAVVSVNNTGLDKRGGMQLMAAASMLEGRTGTFKRTTARMRKSGKINAVALLKDIA